MKQARFLLEVKNELLLEKGSDAVEQMLAYEHEMQALMKEAETNFEMTDAEIAELRQEIRRHVLLVHDAEEEAVTALKNAMA